MIEIEEMHQVADGRAVGRLVEISAVDLWVGQVIEAARREGREAPVALNELEN